MGASNMEGIADHTIDGPVTVPPPPSQKPKQIPPPHPLSILLTHLPPPNSHRPIPHQHQLQPRAESASPSAWGGAVRAVCRGGGVGEWE